MAMSTKMFYFEYVAKYYLNNKIWLIYDFVPSHVYSDDITWIYHWNEDPKNECVYIGECVYHNLTSRYQPPGVCIIQHLIH